MPVEEVDTGEELAEEAAEEARDVIRDEADGMAEARLLVAALAEPDAALDAEAAVAIRRRDVLVSFHMEMRRLIVLLRHTGAC